MNMIDIQDKLKGLSEDQLIREMQMPSGNAPQFLVLSEINRRKTMRDSFAAQQAKQGIPTVAEEVVAAAAVPQQGLPAMASAMAPKSSIEQNTGIGSLPVQGMYAGGPVRKMAEGGATSAAPTRFMVDPVIQVMAERMGKRPAQLWAEMSDQERAAYEGQKISDAMKRQGLSETSPITRAEEIARMDFTPVNPSYDPVAVENMTRPSFAMPSQDELDRRYLMSQMPPRLPDISGYTAPADLPPSTGGAALSPPATSVPQVVDLDLTADQPPNIGPLDYSGFSVGLGGSAGMTQGPEAMMAAREGIEGIKDESMSLPPQPQPRTYPGWSDNSMTPYQSLSDMFSGAPAISSTETTPEELMSGLEPDIIEALKTPSPEGMDTGVPLTAEDAADAVGEATKAIDGASGAGTGVIPSAAPVSAPVASGGASGGAGGGSGGVPASGGTKSFLEQALERADKRAQQDKWLALAQVGLQLMASKEPTFGGALGEAGAAGLEAYRSARDAYDKERLTIEQAIAAQKAAAAKAIRGSGIASVKPLGTKDLLADLKFLEDPNSPGYARPGFEVEFAQAMDAARGLYGGRYAPTM